MEVSMQLFRYLAQLHVLTPLMVMNQRGGNIIVDQETTEMALNGTLICKLMCALDMPHIDAVGLIDKLIPGKTSSVRAFNWQHLTSSVLFPLGIAIPKEIQMQMIHGDTSVCSHVFNHVAIALLQLSQNRGTSITLPDTTESSSSPRNESQGAFVLNKPGKRLTSKASIQENSFIPFFQDTPSDILINTLMESLQIRKDQATTLVKAQPKYFSDILQDGIKGSFSRIIQWLKTLLHQASDLIATLNQTPDQLNLILEVIAPALISKNRSVAMFALELIAQLCASDHSGDGDDLNQAELSKQAWIWFTGETNSDDASTSSFTSHSTTRCEDTNKKIGLGLVLKAFHMHPARKKELLDLFSSFARSHLPKVLLSSLRQASASDIAYVEFLHDYLLYLPSESRHGIVNEIIDTQFAWHLVDVCCRLTQVHEVIELRCAAFACLVDVWHLFMGEMSEKALKLQSMEGVLSCLKAGLRDSSLAVCVTSWASLFRVLQLSVTQNISYASTIYKTTIFACFECSLSSHSLIYHYAWKSMIALLREDIKSKHGSLNPASSTLDIGLFIDPLIRNIQRQGYTQMDFELFVVLVNHPLLTLIHSINLMDVFFQIALNDYEYTTAALVPTLLLLDRFSSELLVQEYMGRLSQYAIQMFMENKKTKKKSTSSVPATSTSPTTSSQLAFSKHQRIVEATIVSVLSRIARLGVLEINERLFMELTRVSHVPEAFDLIQALQSSLPGLQMELQTQPVFSHEASMDNHAIKTEKTIPCKVGVVVVDFQSDGRPNLCLKDPRRKANDAEKNPNKMQPVRNIPNDLSRLEQVREERLVALAMDAAKAPSKLLAQPLQTPQYSTNVAASKDKLTQPKQSMRRLRKIIQEPNRIRFDTTACTTATMSSTTCTGSKATATKAAAAAEEVEEEEEVGTLPMWRRSLKTCFRPWLGVLKKMFIVYTKASSLHTRSDSFQRNFNEYDLKKDRVGLSQWSQFCKDYDMVPKLFSTSQETMIYKKARGKLESRHGDLGFHGFLFALQQVQVLMDATQFHSPPGWKKNLEGSMDDDKESRLLKSDTTLWNLKVDSDMDVTKLMLYLKDWSQTIHASKKGASVDQNAKEHRILPLDAWNECDQSSMVPALTHSHGENSKIESTIETAGNSSSENVVMQTKGLKDHHRSAPKERMEDMDDHVDGLKNDKERVQEEPTKQMHLLQLRKHVDEVDGLDRTLQVPLTFINNRRKRPMRLSRSTRTSPNPPRLKPLRGTSQFTSNVDSSGKKASFEAKLGGIEERDDDCVACDTKTAQLPQAPCLAAKVVEADDLDRFQRRGMDSSSYQQLKQQSLNAFQRRYEDNKMVKNEDTSPSRDVSKTRSILGYPTPDNGGGLGSRSWESYAMRHSKYVQNQKEKQTNRGKIVFTKRSTNTSLR